MQVILRNNGNGRQDAAYVVATEPGPESCTCVIAYYGKWASYTAHGLAGLTRQVKTIAGTSLWQNAFDEILSGKLLRGYAPVDTSDLTQRVYVYLKSRSYNVVCPLNQQEPVSQPPSALPVTGAAKLLGKLFPEPEPTPTLAVSAPVTVTSGAALVQKLAKKPEPAPEPAPPAKPRPRSRAAMLEF